MIFDGVTADDIGKALKGKRSQNGSWRARCPSHDDKHESLSISQKNGKALFKCHAGCGQDKVAHDIAQIMGLNGSAERRARTNGSASKRKEIAAYDYTDEHGTVLYQAVRFEPKDFRQRRPNGKGGYVWNVHGVRPVPYRLPEVIEQVALDHIVVIVEGEKDADNLWRIGIPATTNIGGAGKWKPELSQHFRGADVVIIADNDPQKVHPKTGAPMWHPDGRPVLPGQDHAQHVAAALIPIAARVRVLELPSVWTQCPNKGDISDWLTAGGTAEALWAAVETLSTYQRSPPHDNAPEPPSWDTNAQPFRFTFAKDIKIEPKEFLIEGFLGFDEFSVFFGTHDQGKSNVVIDAQCHVAHGLDYCGRKVKQGLCVYVAAERATVTKRRITAWRKERGWPDIPLIVIGEAIDLRTSTVDTDRVIATTKRAEQLCGQRAVWINFDTLNRVLKGGNESQSQDMGALVDSVDRIRRATGAHCSVIHHPPADRNDRTRGHSSLPAAFDTGVLVAKNDAGDLVTATVDIAKDLVDKPSFTFTFKSVVLITDADGVDTTASVLVPIEQNETTANPETRKRKGPKPTKAARIALRALRTAVDELGSVPPASNHIPSNTRTVTTEQWRQYAYRMGISTSGESRARQTAFQRGSENLIAAGDVAVWDEKVWVV